MVIFCRRPQVQGSQYVQISKVARNSRRPQQSQREVAETVNSFLTGSLGSVANGNPANLVTSTNPDWQANRQFHNLFHKKDDSQVMQITAQRLITLHSSGAPLPSASDSNRVEFLMKAILSLPVGPLRCLAIMISAIPSSSGSSGL